MKRLTFIYTLFGLLTAAAVQAQVEVPLYYDASERRLGIYLGVGGSSQQIYIFDTGSQPLILNSGTDSGTATDQNLSSSITYGAGTFDFDLYNGDVQIMDASGNTYGSASNIDFGKTQESGGQNTGPGVNGGFAGVMGAGPAGDTFIASGSSTDFNLFSLMGQQTLGPDLMPGFSLQIRGANATLTIGITEDAWNATESKVAMNAANPSLPQQYPDGTATHLNNQINSTLMLTTEDGNDTYTAADAVGTRLDTGAPEFSIDNGGSKIDVPSSFLTPESEPGEFLVDPGTELALSTIGTVGPSNAWDFGFTTTSSGTTETKLTDASSSSMNAGLEPFLQYDITFLLDDGDGNGFVGFTTIPEPASGSLLLGAGLVWLLRRRQR